MGEVKVEALRGVSFQIKKASFVSFIGPSGSGKTTLLNTIGCLDKPTSGMLKVADTDVSLLNRHQAAEFRGKNIGFIFQDFNLIPILTAYENVEYPLIMVQNLPMSERRDRVMTLLNAVGMDGEKNKYPDRLSGGQKQRVAVARALVSHPALVLADEPTANLDHDTAYKILNIMKRIKDEMGTAFVFSTHDSKIVGEAEVIYTIEDGKITQKKDRGQ